MRRSSGEFSALRARERCPARGVARRERARGVIAELVAARPSMSSSRIGRDKPALAGRADHGVIGVIVESETRSRIDGFLRRGADGGAARTGEETLRTFALERLDFVPGERRRLVRGEIFALPSRR